MVGSAPEQPKVRAASGDVFISYASHDKAVADAVCAALERHGVPCWIAPRDVVPGESYAGAIVHAIDAAKVVVLVLSASAGASQHVFREVERASARRHPIVAFHIDAAPVPPELQYFLNTSHWLDATALGVEGALPRLVDAVRKWDWRDATRGHAQVPDSPALPGQPGLAQDSSRATERPHSVAEHAGEAARPTPAGPRPRLAARLRLAWMGVAAGLLLVAVSLAIWASRTDYFWRNPLGNAKFTRLLDLAGTGQAAAISRDGKIVAFLDERDGEINTWVTAVGSGVIQRLTHGELRDVVNPSVRTLSFSADSSLVSIWSRRPDGPQQGDVSIVAAPITGGPLQPYLREVAEFDWSHDGKRLVYHTLAPGDPLFVRDGATSGDGGDRRIYAAPAGIHCHFPVWSPDDAYVYFVKGVPPDDWDVWRIRPSGEGLERITSHNSRVSYPVLLDQRTLVYLATDPDGSGPRIYTMDVERRVPHRISSGLESYTSLAASADGTRLVATIARTRTSIWRLPLSGSGGAAIATAAPSLVVPDGAAPRLSADGLVYVAWRGERQGVWAFTQGVAHELWSSADARVVGGPALSPDGRSIAFAVASGRKTLLYTMGIDGSHVRVLADSLSLRGDPVWAPDGRSVVSAVVYDGEPRLTRVFLNGDPPLLLVSEYSLDPVWSPDGRFIVYSGADVGMAFPLRAAAADGRPYAVASAMLTRGARRVAFFGGSQALVLMGGTVDHKNFWILDLRSGAQRVLAELPEDFVIRDFDLAAAGSELVFDRVQMSAELALIERAK